MDHISDKLYHANYKAKRDYRNYLNLASNELNHSKLKGLLQEFHANYLPRQISQYPYYDDLREELTGFLKLDTGSLLLSPGSDTAIATIINYFARKNGIVLHSPNYYNYEYYASINDIHITSVNFIGKSFDDYAVEFCNVLKSTKPSLVVITNPDPYEGKLLPLEKIHTILKVAHKNNHLVVIDETYAKFSGITHLSFLKEFNNLIILQTLSKAYGAAGVRLAFIISSPEIIRLIFKSGIEYGVNLYAMSFAQFIMSYDREYELIKEEIIFNRNNFEAFSRENFIHWKATPSSSIFVSIDMGTEEIAEKVVEELANKNIIVRNLFQFDTKLRGKVRICMSDQETLNKIIPVLHTLYSSFCD